MQSNWLNAACISSIDNEVPFVFIFCSFTQCWQIWTVIFHLIYCHRILIFHLQNEKNLPTKLYFYCTQKEQVFAGTALIYYYWASYCAPYFSKSKTINNNHTNCFKVQCHMPTSKTILFIAWRQAGTPTYSIGKLSQR